MNNLILADTKPIHNQLCGEIKNRLLQQQETANSHPLNQ